MLTPADPTDPADDRTGANRTAELESELERTRADLEMWRARALAGWSEAVAAGVGHPRGDAAGLAAEIEAMRATLSWRITAPLRLVRRHGLFR